MPLDVIMPALGMAQDSGLLVSWHKKPGDAVSEGDVLFEVETDKATMEVEAQANGFLTDVTADEGTDVPVGNVIARISDSAEGSAPSKSAAADTADAAPSSDAAAEDLPEGKEVIMPTLGMSQDTGLLVAWHKAPGDAVGADDLLFEVETDKSTVEVNAGSDGFLAALLAEEGEEVPTGQTIAIISAEAPANPIRRKASSAPPPAEAAAAPAADDTAKIDATSPANAPGKSQPAAAPPPKGAARSVQEGPILASPKARRLAREQGLDLARLAEAGYPQPYHVKDLETLKALPAETFGTAEAAGGASAPAAGRLTAEIPAEGFSAFAAWAGKTAGLSDASALLAGFCAASLGETAVVAVESFGQTKTYSAEAQLSGSQPSDAAPQLRVRDLRFSGIATVQMGAEDIPTLTLTAQGKGLAITLEFATGQLDATNAITLLSNFAGRMEQPLRHLL